jgi:hypothetical protein
MSDMRPIMTDYLVVELKTLTAVGTGLAQVKPGVGIGSSS